MGRVCVCNIRKTRNVSIGRRMFLKIASGGLLIKTGNVLVNIALTVLLTNMLSVDQYGQYVLLISFLTILAAFSHLGFPQVLLKEATRYMLQGGTDLPRTIRRVNIWVLLMIGSAFGLGYVLFLPNIDLTQAEILYFGLPILAFTALGRLRSSLVRGLGRVLIGQLPESIIRPSLILALVALFSFGLGKTLNARDAVIFYLIASATAFIVGSWLLHKSMANAGRDPFVQTQEHLANATLLRTAFYIGIGSSFQLLIGNIEILLLGAMQSPADVGIYKVALTIAMLIFAIEQALNGVATPRISTLIHEADYHQLRVFSTLIARSVFGIGLVVYCLVLLIGEVAIETVFGEDFAAAYEVFLVIGGGMLLGSMFGPVLQVLVMSGNEKVSVFASLIAITANITMGFLFIVLYGVVGAAYATALSLFLWKLLMWLSLHRNVWSVHGV